MQYLKKHLHLGWHLLIMVATAMMVYRLFGATPNLASVGAFSLLLLLGIFLSRKSKPTDWATPFYTAAVGAILVAPLLPEKNQWISWCLLISLSVIGNITLTMLRSTVSQE